MADEKTYVFDSASRNDIPLAYALNNNGWGNGGYGLGGWGGGIVGFLLGLAFGGGWGGFGGFGGGNGISGLVNSDSNRDVVLQAINGTDADVRQLATTLGMNYETISQGISDARLALANVGSQVGLSGLQVQNAIQSGNASIIQQLCNCCCENKTAILNQTNALQAQTGHAPDILLIDNASTDGTELYCRTLAQKNIKIQFQILLLQCSSLHMTAISLTA